MELRKMTRLPHANLGKSLLVINTFPFLILRYIKLLEKQGLLFSDDDYFGTIEEYDNLNGVLILKLWLRVERENGMLWAVRID